MHNDYTRPGSEPWWEQAAYTEDQLDEEYAR